MTHTTPQKWSHVASMESSNFNVDSESESEVDVNILVPICT